MCNDKKRCSTDLCSALGARLEQYEVQRAFEFEYSHPSGDSFERVGMVCGIIAKAKKSGSSVQKLRLEGRLGSQGEVCSVMTVAGMSGDIQPGDWLVCAEKKCRVLSAEKGIPMRLFLSEWEEI